MKKGILALLLLTTLSAEARNHKHTMGHVNSNQGVASWYGSHEQGRKMANGKPFDRRKFTCASRWLPLGSKIWVTNVKTSKVQFVEVTDRGPWIRSRILDLSEAAARNLGCINQGVCFIRISLTNPVSETYEDATYP